MKEPTCIKCGNQSFEMGVYPVIGSPFKIYFIVCNECGTIVQVSPKHDIQN